jgi:DnaJ-class molecular chaperone
MLTLKEALCGFSFELQYINNKLYTINSSSGNIIVPEYKKIIPNLGLQRENYKGNLIIIFNIEFPNSLTEQQILSLKDIL